MKIVKVRFTNTVVAFDDNRLPVEYRFHNAEQGLTIEVRRDNHQVYVYGTLERDGVTTHAGNSNGNWAHNDYDVVTNTASELFQVAKELGVGTHHVWPFVEQLPLFTQNGVSVDEARELAEPIKDLLARGAPPAEVMNTLNVTKELIEFVLGTTLPRVRTRLEPYELDPDTTEY